MARQPGRRGRRPRQDPGPLPARRSCSSAPGRRRSASRPRSSTPYVNTIPREKEPWFPGDEHLERRIRAYIRWNAAMMVVKANKHADGIGGHLSTFASSAVAVRDRVQPLLPWQGRRQRWRPRLLPGPRRARHLRPRVPRGPPHRGRPRPLPPRDRPRRQGPDQLPPPAPDAGLLGVPDGQHGPRPDRRALPGAVQPLPAQPPARRHQPEPRVVLPRRRRVRRARDARQHLAGRPREARQPDLRRELQPAAPRRPGPRQRQDHPGARGHVPRRRLERDQGDLGHEVGRAARQGQGRRAR